MTTQCGVSLPQFRLAHSHPRRLTPKDSDGSKCGNKDDLIGSVHSWLSAYGPFALLFPVSSISLMYLMKEMQMMPACDHLGASSSSTLRCRALCTAKSDQAGPSCMRPHVSGCWCARQLVGLALAGEVRGSACASPPHSPIFSVLPQFQRRQELFFFPDPVPPHTTVLPPR